MRNRRIITGGIAAFALMIGALVGAILLQPGAVELNSGTLLPKPRPIAPFTLSGSNGRPFTNADFSGHWTLVFAGYTFCPDVCPTTLADLASVRSKLGADAGKLQVVFISVDPQRDTPERLDKYVHYFSPDFRAATGDNAALEALGQSLGFVFLKVPGATPESYLMDHSAALMLINPRAELAGYLTPPFKADVIAADLEPLLQRDP